ncbi:MAG: SDR family NAD(P)-dependent oxidoreductase [Candidatus Hydrogenedentota bacterium]|nr:MAG: SDR family NAD(P)-dependent oxidoreductase [Candidatus Hydrogenedentota bacterium]
MTDDFYQGRRCLVTGAGGFIGSHLTEELLRRGARVTALIRYNSRNHWGWLEDFANAYSGGLEVIAGDITDANFCEELVKGHDTVFHLAALIAIPYSYRAPFQYVRVNVEGTANLLQAALRAKVRRFVHTSTSEVYGTAQYVPIDEKHPLQGQSPYSATKIGADKIAESFFRSFDLPVVTVRPFNTYGPRQSARAIIPTLLTQALAGFQVVRVGSLEPRRDLTYVSDTVEGFLGAASSEKTAGGTFNLGTGDDVSIGELVDLIREVTENDFSVETDPERVRPEKSEVMRLCADPTLAREIFGYEPKVSLREGLERTRDWIQGRMEEYKPGLYNV